MTPTAHAGGIGWLAVVLASSPALASHVEHFERFGLEDGAMVVPTWRQDLQAPPVLPTPPPSTTQRATVYGYHPYWGVDPTTLDFERLTHLALFAVEMESSGDLSGTSNWTDVAPVVVPLAHAQDVRVHLTLISFYDSQQAAILPSASKRAQVIEQLVDLVAAYDGDGVNIDFEGLDSAYKDDLVAFTQELKAALPAGQDDVVLATPAIDWYGAYDYDELCAASDGLFIMGYGYHWSGGNPGPISPLFGESPWSDYALDWTIDDYLSWGAWEDCIIVGLPTYGREWPVSGDPATVPGSAADDGDAVLMSSAVSIATSEGRQWDSITHTPYVVRSGSQLWYDDTESLGDKIAWSVDQDLQGVGFWALGYEGEDPDFWQMVEDETTWDSGTGSGGGDAGASDDGASDDGASDDGGTTGEDDGGATSDGDPDEYDGGGQGGEHEPLGTRTELQGGCSSAPVGAGLVGLLLALLAGLVRRR